MRERPAPWLQAVEKRDEAESSGARNVTARRAAHAMPRASLALALALMAILLAPASARALDGTGANARVKLRGPEEARVELARVSDEGVVEPNNKAVGIEAGTRDDGGAPGSSSAMKEENVIEEERRVVHEITSREHAAAFLVALTLSGLTAAAVVRLKPARGGRHGSSGVPRLVLSDDARKIIHVIDKTGAAA